MLGCRWSFRAQVLHVAELLREVSLNGLDEKVQVRDTAALLVASSRTGQALLVTARLWVIVQLLAFFGAETETLLDGFLFALVVG